MKKLIFAFIILSAVSCQKEKEKSGDTLNTTQKMNNSKAAESWLVNAIETHFSDQTVEFEKSMAAITTPKYFEYKMDMMNVGLDTHGALSEDEFRNKWEKDFDLERVELNSGFLIGAQDWGKIKVTDIKLKEQTSESYIFQVEISDVEFETKYPALIKVVNDGTAFKIADVQEVML